MWLTFWSVVLYLLVVIVTLAPFFELILIFAFALGLHSVRYRDCRSRPAARSHMAWVVTAWDPVVMLVVGAGSVVVVTVAVALQQFSLPLGMLAFGLAVSCRVHAWGDATNVRVRRYVLFRIPWFAWRGTPCHATFVCDGWGDISDPEELRIECASPSTNAKTKRAVLGWSTRGTGKKAAQVEAQANLWLRCGCASCAGGRLAPPH